ncbi:hypothetical protein [Streptomyces botrytidirepellens]|uniref:CDI toxin immunity protein n=1 Tax=Streptomyces botrytidirepellens TaxID=2486417 RepID=UPI0011CE92F1|nr:hypothetical protein [Streptomyces botrytidirepellens]
MTKKNSYGTRRDLLPKFMKSDTHEGDLINILDLDESREFESISLNRFPHAPAGTIEWENAHFADRSSFIDEEDGARKISELLTNLLRPESKVTIFWGTLVMPSVILSAKSAADHSQEILEVGPDFWIFSPDRQLILECLQDGQLTVADIPQEAKNN